VLRKDVRTRSPTAAVTADPAAIARFEALAEEWRKSVIEGVPRVWAVHVSERLPALLERDLHEAHSLAGARIDVGCGARWVTEPLTWAPNCSASILPSATQCSRNATRAEWRASLLSPRSAGGQLRRGHVS
jgi:hypothetical protein